MWQLKTLTSNIFKRRTVFVDNFVFRCYYKGSFWILMISCMLVSAKQYFGEHIQCIAAASLKHVINTFCFVSTTFTVVKHHKSKTVAHPGVGPMADEDDVIHHAYYQWVPYILFAQALLFYIPHFLWKLKENKRVIKWSEVPIKKEDVTLRLFIYRDWARWMIFCEVLNFINLFIQVYATDMLLQGKFLDLGFNQNDLETVFPKMTKCTWRQYGPSGTIQKHDVLCVIALNVINEKIFIVLWFWYIFLGILSTVGFLWRLTTFVFHRRLCLNNLLFTSIGSGAQSIKLSQTEKISKYTTFSEWLLIYYLAKNLKFKDFINVVSGLGPQSSDKSKSCTDLSKAEEANLVADPSPSAPERFKLSYNPEESAC